MSEKELELLEKILRELQDIKVLIQEGQEVEQLEKEV